MKKRLLAFLLTLSGLLSCMGCARIGAAEVTESVPQTMTSELMETDTRQKILDIVLQSSGASSVQFALWDDGRITDTDQIAAQDRTGTALSDDTLYGVGSLCKLFVTAAVMQLAESGTIELDAPVTDYLPDFKMQDARYTQITVRMLLNHTSGIMGSNDDNAFLFADTDSRTMDTLLEKLSTQKLSTDPGAFSTYCNTGFALAECIVAQVTGESFPEYVREKLLNPLHLENVYASNEAFEDSRVEKVWYQPNQEKPMPRESITQIGGIGGYYATASDMAAFGGALTEAGILTEVSLTAMRYPEYTRGLWPEDDLHRYAYGLGWDSVSTWPFRQNGIQALYKTGDTLVYHSALVVLPEYRLSAAVLMCGGSSDYAMLGACKILVGELAKKGILVNETQPPFPEAEPANFLQEMEAYAGYYGSSMSLLQVRFEDGKLLLSNLEMGITKEFLPYADGSFRVADGTPWLIRFVDGDNGEVYLYQKNYDDYQELGMIPWSQYIALKLPENPVSEELQQKWNCAYYAALPVSEKYTSMRYVTVTPYDGMSDNIPTFIPGYVGTSRIENETLATFAAPLPDVFGREGRDFLLEETDGVIYRISNAAVYILESSIMPLITECSDYTVTIEDDGYARWYKTGSFAGKTLRIELPTESGFYIYDANGQIIASSVLWGDTSATLPENGYLVFIGNPGAEFKLHITD